jgi:DDE family transposase
VPLARTLQEWIDEHLAGQGYPVPLRKRLAVLGSGLLVSEQATVSAVAASIVADARLEPERVLPAIFRAVLPRVLAQAVAAHAANEGTRAFHHRRFRPVEVILDDSSQGEHVHLLVGGLSYQGILLPLAVRGWRQNVPQPPGEYHSQVVGLLSEIHSLLPALLRDHVRFVADRAFGHPAMLTLLKSLGWEWVLRTQRQTRVQLRDGRVLAAHELAPRPGSAWVVPAADLDSVEPLEPLDPLPAPDDPVAAFKGAGWLACTVVAIWAIGEAEPWLLLTSLPLSSAPLREHARRWAIERLFLSWKSHGWQLDATGLRDPAGLARWLTGLVLATWWRIACAVPTAQTHLADLAERAATPSRSRRPHQPRLPGWDALLRGAPSSVRARPTAPGAPS